MAVTGSRGQSRRQFSHRNGDCFLDPDGRWQYNRESVSPTFERRYVRRLPVMPPFPCMSVSLRNLVPVGRFGPLLALLVLTRAAFGSLGSLGLHAAPEVVRADGHSTTTVTA